MSNINNAILAIIIVPRACKINFKYNEYTWFNYNLEIPSSKNRLHFKMLQLNSKSQLMVKNIRIQV
jgi:hypothetical protein